MFVYQFKMNTTSTHHHSTITADITLVTSSPSLVHRGKLLVLLQVTEVGTWRYMAPEVCRHDPWQRRPKCSAGKWDAEAKNV